MGGTCGQKEEEPAEPVAKPLSKSQKRKARRVQEEKERRSARDNVLQSLSQTALDPETLQALRPLAARGQKETRKEVSARRQALRAAGHHVEDDDVPTPRHNPNSESDVGSSDDSSSEEEATPRPSSAPARTQFAPRRWDEPQSPQEEAQPALKKARTGGEESGSDTAPHPPLAQALAQARQQLGLGDGLGGADEDEGPARLAPSVPRENLPHPRSVSVERRPEIQAARCGCCGEEGFCCVIQFAAECGESLDVWLGMALAEPHLPPSFNPERACPSWAWSRRSWSCWPSTTWSCSPGRRGVARPPRWARTVAGS